MIRTGPYGSNRAVDLAGDNVALLVRCWFAAPPGETFVSYRDRGYPLIDVFFDVPAVAARFPMQISEEKRKNLKSRLRRIEGQVRGVERMVDEDRYCGDILDQIHSVQQALTSVGREITRNHLETCVTDALRSGDEEAAEETYAEIMGLLEKEL